MRAKKGIKLFGEQAIAAMFKEFKQLNAGVFPGKPVIAPINIDNLSPAEHKVALETFNLIQEKCDGKIKGHTCTNGSKQRRFLCDDESVASPTVSFEAMLGTLVIDAFEERDIAIFDVPGAYFYAKITKDKKVLMKLCDTFVDIMCKVDPEYKPYVRYEHGKMIIYVQVFQSLYGCIKSALLWYKLLIHMIDA